MTQPFSLSATYVHLRPDESAVAMEGGDAFWAGIAERTDLEQGRLMGRTPQSKDWDHWERHPAGEEILTLLSGELELVLDMPDGEQRAVLQAGQSFVVPRLHLAPRHRPPAGRADVHHPRRGHGTPAGWRVGSIPI